MFRSEVEPKGLGRVKEWTNDSKEVCYLWLCSVLEICKYTIFSEAAEKLTDAVVGSRVNSTHSVLYHRTIVRCKNLQLTPHNAAWILVKHMQSSHIALVLKSLHQLPVQVCAEFSACGPSLSFFTAWGIQEEEVSACFFCVVDGAFGPVCYMAHCCQVAHLTVWS